MPISTAGNSSVDQLARDAAAQNASNIDAVNYAAQTWTAANAAAITAEATARGEAIAAEATARGEAITAEATARGDNDQFLNSQIMVGGGVFLDGMGSQINVPNFRFKPGRSLSIDCSFVSMAATGHRNFLGEVGSSSNWISIKTGKIDFRGDNGSIVNFDVDGNQFTGAWSNVVMVWGLDDIITVYRNAVIIGSVNASTLDHIDIKNIGAGYSTPDRAVASFRCYATFDLVLTSEDLSHLQVNGLANWSNVYAEKTWLDCFLMDENDGYTIYNLGVGANGSISISGASWIHGINAFQPTPPTVANAVSVNETADSNARTATPVTIDPATGDINQPAGALIQRDGITLPQVRAWCVFDSTLTGTNAPTSGQHVASVERVSAGVYRLTMAVAPNVNACVIAQMGGAGQFGYAPFVQQTAVDTIEVRHHTTYTGNVNVMIIW